MPKTKPLRLKYTEPETKPAAPPAKAPPPDVRRVLDLHTGKGVLHQDSHPAWKLHKGARLTLTQALKPLPGFREVSRLLGKGFPATVGDLARDPKAYGYKLGAAVRYWAPPAPTQGVAVNTRELRLYELLEPQPQQASGSSPRGARSTPPAGRSGSPRRRSAPPGR